MKYVFQVVRKSNGQRSAEFFCEREKLADILRDAVDGVEPDDLILCLGESEDAGSEFSFSRAPLMEVGTFVKHFGGVL